MTNITLPRELVEPEALRLADSISRMDTFTEYQRSELQQAAAELRRLHEVNQELLAVLTHVRNVLPYDRWADDTRNMLDAAITKAGGSNAT